MLLEVAVENVSLRKFLLKIFLPHTKIIYMKVELNTTANSSFKRKHSRTSTILLHILRLVLLAICIYSCTRFAQNPNQSLPGNTHRFTDYYYAMLTNVTAYSTILVVLAGFVYRATGAMRGIYNTALPVILSLEFLVVMIFWPCFFIFPQGIVYFKYLDQACKTPLLTELGVHMIPFLLLFLEQLRHNVIENRHQKPFLFTFLGLYIMMICYLRYISGPGKFPYHVLNLLDPYSKHNQGSHFLFPLMFLLLCLALIGISFVCYKIFSIYMKLKRKGYFSDAGHKHSTYIMLTMLTMILVLLGQHVYLYPQLVVTIPVSSCKWP